MASIFNLLQGQQTQSQPTTTTRTSQEQTFGGTPVTNTTTETFTPFDRDNFDYEGYFQEFKNSGRYLDDDDGHRGSRARNRIWNDYLKHNSDWRGGGITDSNTVSDAQGGSLADSTNIVPGNTKHSGEINVSDAASDIIKDPSLILGEEMSLQEQAQNSQMTGTEAGTNIDPNDPKYQTDTGALAQEAAKGETHLADNVDPRQAQSYESELVADKVADADMEAAQGEVSDVIDAPQIDTEAIANATDKGGVGQALTEYASQDLDDVDKRATAKGQLELLQDDFVDPVTGEPKIPNWAAATARSVSKIIAFTGQSGSAATASMAQAIMEASIPVAMEDAKFYQTLTLENLSNEQAQILNRANVLAKFESENQSARVTAAVENSKNFLAMDLANLSNEQQAAVINNQNRINAMLEDARQINTQRLFTAQSQNEMDMFYDNLNSQINQYNAGQANGMEQFNASQENAMSQFNATLENAREEFYKNMQFQIDTANAKWRQTVTLQEDAQAFEAAATDVKNLVGLSTEQLNRLWDRSDSLLQFAWQSAENEATRANQLAIAQLQARAAKGGGSSTSGALGALAGTILGSSKDSIGGTLLGSAFGW